MDFEQDDNLSQPAGPPSGQGKRPRKRGGWRIFWGVILVLSVMANIVLFLSLIGVVAIFATGQRGIFTEDVIRDGPRTTKIAVITVQGIINGEQAQDVYRRLKLARKDKRV